jgi:hypothetical protein
MNFGCLDITSSFNNYTPQQERVGTFDSRCHV